MSPATHPPDPVGWPGGRTLASGHRLYWWAEVAAVLALYATYTAIRTAATGSATEAFANAGRVMDLQERLGLNIELTWQQWALDHHALVVAANYFYASAYLLVTLGTLVLLYRRFPDSYPLWRNAVVVGTLIALVGFALFPLMPPRLLGVHDTGGGWAFVDTLASFPTPWSFESPAVASIANPFAAMPSLHCGWAMWVCAALWNHLRTWWWRAATLAYVALTVIVVVITANHFVLDVAGAALTMGAGLAVAGALTRAGRVEGHVARRTTTGVVSGRPA